MKFPCLACLVVAVLSGCRNDPPPASLDLALADGAAGDALDGGMGDAGDGGVPPRIDMAVGDGPVGPSKVTMCPRANLPKLAVGTCEVKKGSAAKLITATVLLPGEVLRGGQVLVDETGKIACAACDCAKMGMGATEISCPTGVLSPGLINTHDHISYQSSPGTDSGERYEHRHDWRKGIRGHTKISSGGLATNAQVQLAELRFVLGGATSSVSSGNGTGLLRNLDKPEPAQGGLMQKPVDFDTFPLGDSGGTLSAMGCGAYMINPATAIAADDAYFPHISEGIDENARNEFLCASSAMGGGQDLAQAQSAFIHSIGLKPSEYALMAAKSVALVWSPRSNVRLYGDTAVVREASRFGVLLTLGTDWVLSGSMNLLRELRCADELNRTYYDRYFSDEELWLMVTRYAAIASATDDVIGAIRPGLVADLAIFDGEKRADHRAIVAAEVADVVLVLRGGKPLYGDTKVVEALALDCDPFDVCGRMKSGCLKSEINMSLADLQKTVGPSNYPLFFCGLPKDEPTCVPSRPKAVLGSTVYTGLVSPSDGDGDGVPDVMDNCPKVFNPVRPVDGGKQGDADDDGVGDACDPCPLEKNGMTCKPVNLDDVDGDGIPNLMDNCPQVANPDQKDLDMDMKGDKCDPCPMDANLGDQGCPATIYAIKTGKVALDTVVAVKGVVVTGKAATGYFVQVKAGDPGYLGADNSAVFVYSPMPTVNVGDRVDLTAATVSNFNGQIQLVKTTAKVTAMMVAAPLPAEKAMGTPFLPADLAMGAKAAALEGVIVRVGPALVSDDMPMPGVGDVAPTNEVLIDNLLRVDDLLYLPMALPKKGESFVSITGVLVFKNGLYKLEPRGDADFVAGAPRPLSVGPDAFVRVGAMNAPAIPSPLLVTLSRAVAADTPVLLMSSDALSLTVPKMVVVPNGMAQVAIPLTALQKAMKPVLVTATLNNVSVSGSVRILDAMEAPTLTDLQPAVAGTSLGGKVTMTVTLDLPAPAPLDVLLTSTTANTVPKAVTVPKDAVTAAFTYQQAGMGGTDTITATLGNVMKTAKVSVRTHLVINEIDYDQPANDTDEFIEIYNPTGVAVDLTNLAVVLVNGSDSKEYARFNLKGMLENGGYLVLASATVMVDMNATRVAFGAARDNVQNGAPDGVAIIDKVSGEVIDALSYEGSLTMAQITGLKNARNLVEGMATMAIDPGTGSLIRDPNARDTDNAASDWFLTMTPTPGKANLKN